MLRIVVTLLASLYIFVMGKKFCFGPLLFLFVFSCTQMRTIGFQEHHFGKTPRHIVWFQIAGLDSEHLAMLKYSLSHAKQITEFEKHLCLGHIWNFNLFKIRPSSQEGFMAQMTGSKNIQGGGGCADYERTPLWDYFAESKGFSGVIELGTGKNALDRCYKENPDFYKNVIIWKMGGVSQEGESFHIQIPRAFEQGRIYYDKSCRKKDCFSKLAYNAKSIWDRHFSSRNQTLFIIRDFAYLKALKNKNISKARQSLTEIDKLLSYFIKLNNKNKDEILIVVSGSESRRFEFPRQGQDWASFDEKGHHVLYRRSGLISPVYAWGSRAENFCGIYDESEILKRFLLSPSKK